MSRPRSAGAVFWGLTLISVGMIFLLKNLGFEIPIWMGIATYWPLLLILWGSIKLVDYARWKRAGQPGPLFGAGEVVLLIIVILSGAALTAAANLSPDFGRLFEMADIDLWDITGNSYPYSEHYEMDATAGSSIEIVNRYGSVVVTPADTDLIVVDVAKTVIAANQMDADRLSTVLMYSITQENGRYRVISTFNRDESSVRGRRFKTSLTVKVPRRSALTVNNRNGSVEISDITGDQQVRNSFGSVVLRGITGAVQTVNGHDTVILEDITGAAKITNEFAAVEARRINGALEVKNRNGSVDVEEIRGNTAIDNQFGSIDVKDIQGSLTIDARMTSVDVRNVENDVTVENQFNSVSIEDVRGQVHVENRNGNVELRYAQPPRNNVRVTSQFGDVTVILPSNSTFSIDARTRFASISTDFPELVRRDEDEPERNTLTGRVGAGGPDIRIDNQNGSIHIQK